LGLLRFGQLDNYAALLIQLLFFGTSFLKMAVFNTAAYSDHPKQNFFLGNLKIKLAQLLNRATFTVAIIINL